MTVREVYAYGLIAGISVKEARKMEPGFVMDMFKVRADYDIRLHGKKPAKERAETVDDL